MQSLLRWSIENSAGEGNDGAPQPPPAPRKDLDPGIIDMILGKSDAELMKEALAIATDEQRSEDDRLHALDNFEMLVEHIDNANDLVKLKMWEPLQALLTAPSSTDEIKTQVLWIVGTAVQNNPAAQSAYLSLSPIRTILSFLSPSIRSAKTRSKAVYALSSLLKHCAAAVQQFEDADGWEALKGALEDSDISVRRKTAFLINALLIPTTPNQYSRTSLPSRSSTSQSQSNDTSVILHPSQSQAQTQAAPNIQEPVHPNSHASMAANPRSHSTSELTKNALEAHGLLQALINALTSPVPYGADGEKEGDAEFEDKIISVLHTYVATCYGRIPKDQAGALSHYIQGQTKGDIASLAERWGLSQSEAERFIGEVEAASRG